MRNCDEVWDSFLGFMQVAVKKANARRLQLSGKYMPNRDQNREQRRKKRKRILTHITVVKTDESLIRAAP